MVARAESAAATGERILDAAIEVFWELPHEAITLDEVARRAGVTVQTVIRRFGGRDGLFAAAAARETARVRDQRYAVVPGDVRGAVHVLVDHYEEMGDRIMRLLADEDRIPELRSITDEGRAFHREWCAGVFAPSSPRRLAQVVAICDVYTWKLLRRDSGLSRRQTELALVEMLEPLV
jgi:AcrR family transcriptional regulator